MGDAVRRTAGRAFVGRDREVAELVSGLEDAAGGRGRLFLIAGEPGIGKTWLAERVAEHATSRGLTVVWGRCWEGGGAPPFWPWGRVVDDLCRGRDPAWLVSSVGAGAHRLAQIATELGRDVKQTADLPPADPQQARFALMASLASVLRAASGERPVLL